MTREELRVIADLDHKINCLEDEVKKLQADAKSVRSMDFGSGVRSSNYTTHGDLIARICDMQQNIIDEKAKLIDLRAKAKVTINKLDSIHYTVISKRYLQGKSWIEVASDMHYSQSHVLRLHIEAIDMLEKM